MARSTLCQQTDLSVRVFDALPTTRMWELKVTDIGDEEGVEQFQHNRYLEQEQRRIARRERANFPWDSMM